MLEMIERVFAALIILSLLVIVLFLAFPEREGGGIFGSRDTQQTEPETQTQTRPTPQPETQPSPSREVVVPDPSTPPSRTAREVETRQEEAAPKGDLKTVEKIEEQLPKSKEVRQRRVNQTTISQGRPESSEAPVQRKPYRRTYVRRAEYRDPWRRSDYYECTGGECDCSCDRPYWARQGAACWDW